MAQDAVYNTGDPFATMQYTPGTAVAAGQVVVIGGASGLTCGVAHLDIPAATLGALAIGGGKYRMLSTEVPVLGAKVSWDNATKKLTTVAGTVFGFIVELPGGGGANSEVVALHHPYV